MFKLLLIIRTLLLIVAALGLSLLVQREAYADTSDPIASEQLTFENADGARVLETTAQDVRRIFELYVPAVDDSSTIVSPKMVSGSAQMPRLEVGIRACVFVICRTVQIDSDIVIQPAPGKCLRNLVLVADLRRSTALLSEHFDTLNVEICLDAHPDHLWHNSGAQPYDLTFTASAHHAAAYSGGIVASNALRMLKLQTQPILQALNQTLIENGAQSLSVR